MAKFIIKNPPGRPAWEADNWRSIDSALREMTITANKVDSPTKGLAAIQGKVKVNQYDSTAEYLEDKIVASNSTTFVQSNDGTGAREIKVHSKVIEDTSAPSDMIAGELLFDTDARFGTPFEIGDGETDVDYEVLFKGATHEGSYTWMEGEDYLLCADDLLMSSTENIYFRDTSIAINSGDDGHLDLTADVSIDLNAAADTDLVINLSGTTNSGVLTWMEDEDYLKFGDGILMNGAEEIFFRDTAIHIKSADDGHLDLTADTLIDMNGVVLATDKIAFTQTDLNEYIDSLADGYIDYRATTGHRFGDGTNYTMLSAGGTQTMAGTARVWKSIDINPQFVKLPGANPPADDNIDGFGFHRYNRGTEESVYYTFIVPDDFASGDASLRGFYGFVVANPPASPAANENVRMGFEYKRITEGAVFDFSTGTTSGYLDEAIVADETAYIVHLTGYGTCTTTGWVPHDKILFRFYRDATAPEDTYDNEASADDNDVWVKAYHLEYLADKLGGASS